MIIKSLELKNYRNYDELSMNFASGTNLLYGDNAQGKTNILESIYLSATTKSHRGNKDRELIKFEENEAHIRIHFEKQGIDHQLDMHLKKNKAKGVAIDRIPIRPALCRVCGTSSSDPENNNPSPRTDCRYPSCSCLRRRRRKYPPSSPVLRQSILRYAPWRTCRYA